VNEPTVTCPKCKSTIKLTDAMAAPLIEATRREFAAKLETEKAKIVQKAKNDAAESVAIELRAKTKEVTEVQKTLAANNVKLQEAQTARAEVVKQKRALDEKTRELDLTIERRVTERTNAARLAAQREADERYRLVVDEKDQTISKMRADLEEARQRADQGSQKTQGEVLELEFERALRLAFPVDEVLAVGDRVGRGDLHQQVRGAAGSSAGTIVWELKRTKYFSDDWLPKLRGIQREMRAVAAVVVSAAVPEGVESFAYVDGVWVSTPRYAIALAHVLRLWTIDVDGARRAGQGQQTKTEMVYAYLTGPHFRHRVEAVVERFAEMRVDLDKERPLIVKAWEKRGKQLDMVQDALAGLYGDLQGIAGSAVMDLPVLEVKQLEDGELKE